MKVIAKVTILDRILEDISKLQARNREPDYIVVTPEEMVELKSARRVHQYLTSRWMHMRDDDMGSIDASTSIRVFELVDTSRASYARNRLTAYRAYSDVFVQGIPVYAVPRDYHPR